MSPSSMLNNPGPVDSETPRFDVFVPAQTGLPPMNARLGVLGGAYNPITRAHLRLAHYAREQHKLHEVIFVLPKTLPNKPVVDTPIEKRLEMMRLGTNDVGGILDPGTTGERVIQLACQIDDFVDGHFPCQFGHNLFPVIFQLGFLARYDLGYLENMPAER